MKPTTNHGIKRVIRATGFSFQGIKAAWTHEAAFREELILAAIMLPLALWLDVSVVEKLLLIFSLFLVLIVELVNSAIEAVVDRISDEIHPLSGRAKDIGSGAVFMALCFCVLTWGMILWTHFF